MFGIGGPILEIHPGPPTLSPPYGPARWPRDRGRCCATRRPDASASASGVSAVPDGLVNSLADRTLVLRNGEIVEAGPTNQVLSSPRDSYTRALRDAAPELDPHAHVPAQPDGPR